MVASKDDTENKKDAKPAEGGADDAEAAKAKAKQEAKKAAADANRAKAKKAKDEAAASALKMAAPGETKVSPSTKTTRLQDLYRTKVVPALMKEFNFKSAMQVPRITKVVINCAVKEAIGNPKVLDGTYEEVMTIAGQKPVLTKAKKAIAAFKVRKGNTVGVMVTLRRARAYEFLDRLMNVAMPRVRDFKGVSPKSFDGRGNYSLGIREQIIFPEINYDRIDKVRGMTITVTTTAKNNEHARALLSELGMPFRK
jgi:large subunit ribosomal protein L5